MEEIPRQRTAGGKRDSLLIVMLASALEVQCTSSGGFDCSSTIQHFIVKLIVVIVFIDAVLLLLLYYGCYFIVVLFLLNNNGKHGDDNDNDGYITSIIHIISLLHWW